jgi:hypothetical protein
MPIKRILWDVNQAAGPCEFEILFVARLDDDHRVAHAPFSDPAHVAGLTRDAAIGVAMRELNAIPEERLEQLARSGELLDREQLAAEELNR